MTTKSTPPSASARRIRDGRKSGHSATGAPGSTGEVADIAVPRLERLQPLSGGESELTGDQALVQSGARRRGSERELMAGRRQQSLQRPHGRADPPALDTRDSGLRGARALRE